MSEILKTQGGEILMPDGRKPELLAPSGDMEAVRTALRFGADAIYLGGPFMQLRASSAGFDEKKLAEASELIHSNGKRMYVTVNCFANNDEIPKLGEYARFLKDIGADAVIVSDIGAVAEIKQNVPDIEVHVSTQANCMNYRAARVYYDLGASRIVLARELSLEQIAEIRANTPADLQLEGFIHGAMCMSYSGRCMLSAFLAGRSGNRGQCAQTCRWNYYLMEEKRPGEFFKVEESEQGMAILSSKEMCCASILDRMAAAGICSFKIEGRMRTPFYIGTVVNAYRMLIDGRINAVQALDELDTTSHRPFCTGFYLGDPESIAPDTSGYIRNCLFVASALADSADGKLLIETRNPFAVGDKLEILSPGSFGRSFVVESMESEEGEPMQRSAVPMRHLTINAPDGIKAQDILRKRL